MTIFKHIFVFLILITLSASSRAETVALALSGGGARGFAHIGVLQALEEEGLRPDLIVGSSMGAVVGGLYAAGYSTADLKSIALSTDWSSLFFDKPARRNLFLAQKETSARHILSLRFRGWSPEVPVALSSGQKLSELMFDLAHRAAYQPWPSFDDLKVPFRAVATDLVTGKAVIFSRGDLSEAMRASISLPLVFTPYRLDTLLLVDGGVTENIPVEISRDQGAQVVIAVDLSTGFDPDGSMEMPWELADRVTSIMHQGRNESSRRDADLVITPEVGTHKSTDFANVDRLIEAGYRAAKALMPQIKQAFAKSSHAPAGMEFCSRALYDKFMAATPADSLPPRRYEFPGVTLVPDTLIRSLPMGNDGLRRLALLRRTYTDGSHTLAHATSLELTTDRVLRSRWEEGTIRRITVSGLVRTRADMLLDEFPLSRGDVFDLRRAKRGVNQIYGSDLFETVTLSVTPSDTGSLITIRATERHSPQLRLGAGFSLERKGRGFAEFLNDNMLDIGARLTLFAKYGEMDEEARAGITFDRFPLTTPLDELLQSYLTTDMRGGWKREEFNYYNGRHNITGSYFFDRSGAELWVGRAFRRWGELSGGAQYENIRSGGVPNLPMTIHVTTVGVRSLIDTKDRYPFPNSGIGVNARYDYSFRTDVQSTTFNRIVGMADGYLPLSRRWVVHTKAGYAWNDRELPLWGEFPLGGQESMLGLHDAERYGNTRAQLLGELRFDLISRWLADAYLSAEYTVGAVSPSVQTFPQSSDFQHGVGLSLSLSTFLGPIKFTGSELLRSSLGREQFRLYLDVGHDF
jgi:predicted acylesterase/phospholipase RssA